MTKDEKIESINKEFPKYAEMFKRVFDGKHDGETECIRAFCLECNGYDRPLAETCTCSTCPLLLVNPWIKRNKKQTPTGDEI